MRTTVALDDDLVRLAQEYTGVAEKTALIREALKALIERESARRLASLGGTMPSHFVRVVLIVATPKHPS
jgi:Arc/MetJ family transcription regulator